jgi:hypothetical protein
MAHKTQQQTIEKLEQTIEKLVECHTILVKVINDLTDALMEAHDVVKAEGWVPQQCERWREVLEKAWGWNEFQKH